MCDQSDESNASNLSAHPSLTVKAIRSPISEKTTITAHTKFPPKMAGCSFEKAKRELINAGATAREMQPTSWERPKTVPRTSFDGAAFLNSMRQRLGRRGIQKDEKGEAMSSLTDRPWWLHVAPPTAQEQQSILLRLQVQSR